MYLGKYTKMKNYKRDCEPATNGASIRFYDVGKIEKDGELVEQQLLSVAKDLCKNTGFSIPKNKPFSIFIVEGETI